MSFSGNDLRSGNGVYVEKNTTGHLFYGWMLNISYSRLSKKSPIGKPKGCFPTFMVGTPSKSISVDKA